MTWSACLCGDDRPHVLAIDRAGQIASLQAVDDLDRAAVLGVPHELEHSMFEDYVGEVQLLELLDSDLGNELRITLLFRIGRVETLFVLDVDHRARSPDFTDKIAAGIGAVRWNAANLRIGLPICVRRHADRDNRVALGEIKRELSELGRLDRWNAVLRQK